MIATPHRESTRNPHRPLRCSPATSPRKRQEPPLRPPFDSCGIANEILKSVFVGDGVRLIGDASQPVLHGALNVADAFAIGLQHPFVVGFVAALK